MRPRTYWLLTLSIVPFVLFVVILQFVSFFNRVLAQADKDTPIIPAAVLEADDLDIQLVASNDGPTLIGHSTTLTATVTRGSATGLTFYWNFGDSLTDRGQVVKHTYAQVGTYAAFVIATDGVHSKRAATTVIIKNPPPTPKPPYDPIEELKGASDSPTYAGNPTGFVATVKRGTDVRYTWNFGDGSDTMQGSSVSHTYQAPGDYTVTIRAENDISMIQKTFLVWIFDAPPQGLQVTHDTVIAIDQLANFSARVERGTNVHFEWTFSNGAPPRTGADVQIPFNRIETVDILVRAWNKSGEIFATLKVPVHDQPPQLIATTNDSPKKPGQLVTFYAAAISRSRVTFQWNFGDGQTGSVQSDPKYDQLQIKEASTTHQYSAEGNYLAILTASNERSSVQQKMIVSIDIVIMTTGQDPTQVFFYKPSIPIVGELVTFTMPVLASDYNCNWDFGDQSQATDVISVTHVFQAAKDYIVEALCLPKGNQQAVGSLRIVTVGGNLFLPIAAKDSPISAEPTPGGTGNGPVGNQPVLPTATPTVTATPTPTATATPTVAATPTPQATTGQEPFPTPTPTATPTLILTAPPPAPTVTSTATMGPGGTIPQP